jgi:serine/threonine-protein kinase
MIVVLAAATLVIVLVLTLVVLNWPTVVPDLTTVPVAQAPVQLRNVWLRLGTTSYLATGAVGAARIVEQDPPAGTSVSRRTSVDVTVAVPSAPAPVPNLVGRTGADAAAILTKALYLPASVVVFGPDEQRGVVVEQVPVAGRTWTTGQQVAIAVGGGPDDGSGVNVPDLTGQTVDKATARLQELGLPSMGFVVNLDTPAKNLVVDQLPAGGTIVARGTTVLLLFRDPADERQRSGK